MLLLILVVAAAIVNCERNSQSEGVCAPFLTGKSTTPLDPKNIRDLVVDEDAEFECELVLQDPQLPLHIRGTIHEGLGYLAVRHCQLGLRRHRDVIRHLDIMTQIAPTHHSFAYRAGYWSLEPQVNEPYQAIKYLGMCG